MERCRLTDISSSRLRRLPRAALAAPLPRRGRTNMVQPSLSSLKQIVLVVEDEPIVRMMALDIVEDAGFVAIEAASADEAVLILESRTDIRIVFTDIEMPGSMDGLRLAQAIRGRWPPIELILTSGRCKFREEEIPAGSRFFGKPYHPDEITQALHQLAA